VDDITAGKVLFETRLDPLLLDLESDVEVIEDVQTVDIVRIISHPKFVRPIRYDAAIIKLKSPLSFNSRVKPACLPDPSFAPEKKAGVESIVSGWGMIKEGIGHYNYSPYTGCSNSICTKTNAY
jgi:hypothetical protein